MIDFDDTVSTLTELGLSNNQAKVYLALVESGTLTAQKISLVSEIARPDVYRVLNQLCQEGFVERIVKKPEEFQAVSIDECVSTLMQRRKDKTLELKKRTSALTQKLWGEPGQGSNSVLEKALQEERYKIAIICGKERLFQKIRNLHDNAHSTINVLTTLQRWLQILHGCYSSCRRSVERGVRYRIVLETSNSESPLPRHIRNLVAHPNFHLRSTHDILHVNAAIFDGKEATFCLYPKRHVADSPLVWTNHSSFLKMYQDHFENIWNSASRQVTKPV
jgi:sugar-specific transcriptional regulator TrmB